MTYQLQTEPDKSITLASGSIRTPVATLKDEYGGVSHITIDDHCYVLVNGDQTVKHWYKEAVAALQALPADPMELETSICCAAPKAESQQPGSPVKEPKRPT